MSTFPLWTIDRLRMGSDGVGITALVCAHGCPLSCVWCINKRCALPESLTGNVTPEELYALVKKDGLYYSATGGGVTFGGGEPMLHAAFIREFRALIPEEWNLYVETSLFVPPENIDLAADRVSTFYVDIKDTDPGIYRRYTGCDNALPLSNLKRLLFLAGPDRVVVRLPHIPGYNTGQDVERSKTLLAGLGITRFDEFAYRKITE